MKLRLALSMLLSLPMLRPGRTGRFTAAGHPRRRRRRAQGPVAGRGKGRARRAAGSTAEGSCGTGGRSPCARSGHCGDHRAGGRSTFNAGKGAVFTHDGRNELDAAVMDGANQAAGAVAGGSGA